MKSSVDAVRIKIYTSENHKLDNKPLYETVVKKALELQIAGATVVRGVYGYGVHHTIHSAKLLELSDNLPLIIEIVDVQEKLDRIMPLLDTLSGKAVVTFEKISIVGE
jgi:PII-like signaling protein